MSCVPHPFISSRNGATGHSPAREIVKLRVPEQELNRAKIPSPPVDQRRLGPAHRVRTVGGGIEPDLLYPGIDDARVLPSAEVR